MQKESGYNSRWANVREMEKGGEEEMAGGNRHMHQHDMWSRPSVQRWLVAPLLSGTD